MSIADKITALDETLTNCKTALADKGVEGTENIKLSDVDEKIAEVKGGLGDPPVAGKSNELLKGQSSYPKHIVFTDIEAPEKTSVTDWSEKGNKSIVKWLDRDTETLYVSTQTPGLKMKFPTECSFMFNHLNSDEDTNDVTETIEFNNVDTSEVTSMNSMFVNCSKIYTLDLCDFDISSLQSARQMFYNCANLTNIYAYEWYNEDSNVDGVRFFMNCPRLFPGNYYAINYAKWSENKGFFLNPKRKTAHVYGIKIVQSTIDPNERVFYTNDAVGMEPVKVNLNTGVANYNGWDKTWIFDKVYPVLGSKKLNPNNYSLYEDGSSAPISDSSQSLNAMVCLDRFYTRLCNDFGMEVIEISDTPLDGFSPLGFTSRSGGEASNIQVCMFGGSLISNKLRSLSGQTITYSKTISEFQTAATANGTNYDLESWAVDQLLEYIYLILMKSTNPWGSLGKGRTYQNATTGLLNTKGPIAYDPSSGCVKFMHKEDFITDVKDGAQQFEVGTLIYTQANFYVKWMPPYDLESHTDYKSAGYFGVYSTASKRWMKGMKLNNDIGRVYDKSLGNSTGTNDTYECCWWDWGGAVGKDSTCVKGGDCGVSARTSGAGKSASIGAGLSLTQL